MRPPEGSSLRPTLGPRVHHPSPMPRVLLLPPPERLRTPLSELTAKIAGWLGPPAVAPTEEPAVVKSA